MLDLQSVPIPSKEFGVREVGDETVFLTPSGREYLNLNAVGSFIWKQMDGIHTLQDIVDLIVDEFEVELDRAESDLRTFVGELEGYKLLTLKPADG